MEPLPKMIWVIVLLVIGFVILFIYRLYYYPSLSQTAKKQQAKYIQAFREEKKLVYQMDEQEKSTFLSGLKRNFFDAGFGCFYGPTLMVHVTSAESQVTIQVFSDDPHNLTRAVWKVLKCKPEQGGTYDTAPDG
jgi:hypothetical protein